MTISDNDQADEQEGKSGRIDVYALCLQLCSLKGTSYKTTLHSVLQEMEKSIGEADAKVAALKAQQAELDSQAGAVRQHCEELRQEQEEESAAECLVDH